jgi:PEP-CTERM motif
MNIQGKLVRRTVSIFGSLACILVVGAPNAHAAPTFSVDGISVPAGIVLGGNVKVTQSDNEVLLNGTVGQSFYGVGKVGLIQDNSSNVSYFYGQNGRYLTDVFSGFTVSSVTAPTATTGGTILLSGGSLNYYVSKSDPNIATGNQLSDLANAAAGTLWLSLVPAAIDAAGHTLEINIPAGSSLSAFNGASAEALLDVNLASPGDAGLDFHTCTFAESFDTNGICPSDLSDTLFIGSAGSGVSGDFGVGGSDVLKSNAIPEPASLALLSSGLLGMAWFSRRRRAKN